MSPDQEGNPNEELTSSGDASLRTSADNRDQPTTDQNQAGSDTAAGGSAEPANSQASTTPESGGVTGRVVPAGPPTAPTPTTSASAEDTNDVLDANVGDQPSAQDTLGFGPYVKAIASFLTNEYTHPPLTLSIEGEWGSGKSSFMLQLEEELCQEGSGIVTSFNAWRYDKDEAMWAAFALEFTRQLAAQLKPFYRRWLAHGQLFILRFNGQRGWRDLMKLTAMLLILIGIFVAPLLARNQIREFVSPSTPQPTPVPSPSAPPPSPVPAKVETGTASAGAKPTPQSSVTSTPTPQPQVAATLVPSPTPQASPAAPDTLTSTLHRIVAGGGLLGYLVLVVGLGIKAKKIVGNPLNINLKQDLDTPDYQSRVAFIKSFHDDFGKVVDVYAQHKKVYVFIDDLDRCEVPKAADLMQALNLMISDSPRLIFIMGMDREKVAAGLAVKYEKLLPYLASPATSQPSRIDPIFGLEYGYNFIEKFIQLPFLIPQAGEAQVQGFLDHIFKSATRTLVAAQLPPTLEAAHAGEQAEKIVTENSEMVTDIIKMVAPTFDYNPRRLKQFINAFRLKTFIASRTGLFGAPPEPARYTPLTTRQLGKFVTICLRWPLMLADLEAEDDLLAKLQNLVLERVSPSALVTIRDGREELIPQFKISAARNIEITERVVRWYRRENLRKLLAARLFSADGSRVTPDKERIYSLEKLDVARLLQVSATRTAPLPKAGQDQTVSAA